MKIEALMAKLVFSLDDKLLGEYNLDKPSLRIGRRRDNDIVIDNLMISSEHAEVMSIGQQAWLHDLESTNGTMVNGVRVQQQILQHGDVIMLGHYQLHFIDDAVSTAIPLFDLPASQPQRFAEPPPAASLSGYLYVISGPDFGKQFPLLQAINPIGVNAMDAYAIEGGATAVPSALISLSDGEYHISCQQGQGPVSVNGVMLPQAADGHGLLLQDHDLIELDGVKIEFFMAAMPEMAG